MDIFSSFRQVVREADTAIDVGAHSGQLSLFFSDLVGKEGRVIAIEANPWTYCVLSSTIIPQRDNIIPVCRAASNAVGRMEILVPDGEGSERSTISRDFSESFGWNIKNKYLIETDTLDNICRIHKVLPDFIKIDTEGAENLVIEGAAETIRTCLPKIAFEFQFNPDWVSDVSTSPHMSHLPFLRGMGYEILLIGIETWASYKRENVSVHSHGFPQDSYISFEESEFAGMKTWMGNAMALHRDAHKDILDAIKVMPFAAMRNEVMIAF